MNQRYNQIEKFVNSHRVLKNLQMEKIAPAGKWTYAFIISGNHLDFPYRDNVKSSSVSEITRRLTSFAETVEKAQEVVKPYVDYFSSEYEVFINFFANKITLVHKETSRKYTIRLKEDRVSLSRLVMLRPKTKDVLVGREGKLEFLVKLKEYSRSTAMRYICQAMEDERRSSLVDYLDEI